jgi:hypothetical protein
MQKEEKFNYEEFEKEALDGLRNGKRLEGKDGELGPLLKRLLEAGLQYEAKFSRCLCQHFYLDLIISVDICYCLACVQTDRSSQ